MYIIDPLRRATGLTAAEVSTVLVIAILFIAGWIGRSLTQSTDRHNHAAAQRVIELLDSMVASTRADSAASFDQSSNVPTGTQPDVHHTRAPTPTKQTIIHKIAINSSSIADWDQLPGIGPATAKAIVSEQRQRPFQRVEDLMRVRGIGPKKLERLRPYVTSP